MSVTVVIPTTVNTRDYLDLCVRSLKATTDWPIIVVTNGPKSYSPSAEVKLLHKAEQGQCGAVNLGAQYVQTDWMMVCNDDMYFPTDWTRWMRFDDLCFSPNLIEPTNNPGSAPPFIKLDAGFEIAEFNKEAVDELASKKESEAPTNGFNLPFFIRTDVFRSIGGYDESYDHWGSNSDTDLQTKVELAGITPKRYRDVQVYHFSNKSGTFDGTHQEDWQRNFDYYRDKWGFTRDDDPETDVWMGRKVLLRDRNIYNPPWKDKYANV